MNIQYNFFDILEECDKIDATPKTELPDICPVCGEEIIRNGRCKTCYSCGWSSCDL